MDRRTLLRAAGAAPLANALGAVTARALERSPPRHRVRPGGSGWPSDADWADLNGRVGGRLTPLQSPFSQCVAHSDDPACAQLFKDLKNPYFIADSPVLTQTLGWVDAWTTRASAYAVAAKTSTDVAEAVSFARRHDLRLVVKGGGHSYLGGSNAPDSLLIWTKPMNTVSLHDAFTPSGCQGRIKAQPAVSLGAGAMWMEAYTAVTTVGGRYVQGGGCTTVGVAGLVQSGGFGSFSKAHGTAAAALLEAEVVTADGAVRTVNACSYPDLFWALKGGGGGTFGVVTRMTLKTVELTNFFGAVSAMVQAKSDGAYRRLVEQIIVFYQSALFNPHWGEQITFRSGRRVSINMVFHGLDQAAAKEVWRPFFAWITAAPDDYDLKPPLVLAIPAQKFWDPKVMKAVGAAKGDDRPGAPSETFYWTGDGEQVGQVLHAYKSAWLPKDLLQPKARPALIDAIVDCASRWGVSLHFNKGLAGAPSQALDETRDTATNPAVLDAFALAISAGNEPAAYPGVAGHEPDLVRARQGAAAIAAAFEPIRRLLPAPASYLSESDYFETDWPTAYWGAHAPRLAAIKEKYDPTGLFFVHNGVGSHHWSTDGFTELAS